MKQNIVGLECVVEAMFTHEVFAEQRSGRECQSGADFCDFAKGSTFK